MGIQITLTIVFVGVMVFAAHLFAELFRSKKVPDVLLLIIIGLIIGPLTGLVDQRFFGQIGSVFANITLVIILFEGGTGLRYDVLRTAIRGTASLTTVNFVISAIITGLATLVIFDFDPIRSFMLGAFLGGTASAIVIPMVGQLNLQSDSKTILVLESAVSDVLCVVVGLTFFEAFKLGELRFGAMVSSILAGFFFSAFIGFLGGLGWSFLINKIRNLQNSIFTTPAFVFIVYGIAELLGFSGAIAALLFGITLANIDVIPKPFLQRYTRFVPHTINETERVFFAEVVFLLKTFFFVYIGISIALNDYFSLAVGGMLTLLLYAFRIPIVRISVRPSIPVNDRIIISLMVPKGLAAAVLASLPAQTGMPGGELIQNITYSTVLISIVFNSLLIMLNSRYQGIGKAYSYFLRP
jgi:NhaP-type Na+/H+ or K+/H+ antiporter